MSSTPITIFGFNFTVATSLDDVVNHILYNARQNFYGEYHFLITPNAYTVVHYLDKKYKTVFEHYNNATYILPDGIPIVWLSKILGSGHLPYRLTGSDLFPILWKRIKETNYKTSLVLSGNTLKKLFHREYNNCVCHVPAFFDKNDDDYIIQFSKEVADGIIANNSSFLFIGLNFPKQEKLGMCVVEQLKIKGFTGGILILLLGASFEFYFNLKKRAPSVFKKTGFEWLYRFISEPRRLWKRYTIDVARFLLLSVKEILRPSSKKKIVDLTSLRIGILGTRGIPNRYGGFEQCAEFLSQRLAAMGHEVWVYSTHNHEYQEKNWKDVNIVHCNNPETKFGTIGQFIYDWNCLQDAKKKKFDIILQLGYTSSSIWFWNWPKQSKTIINMDGLEWQRSKYSKPVQKFLKYAECLAVKHADLLVSDSLGIQEHIEKVYKKQSVYIPYGANIFINPDVSILTQLNLFPYQYHLIIARLVPENSIDIIIDGYLLSEDKKPLVVIGKKEDVLSAYFKRHYAQYNDVIFLDEIYDVAIINSLRYFSAFYFHGHSVGGTNPSLLEAMACKALIGAHDNIFNRAILGDDGFYFQNKVMVAELIKQYKDKQEFSVFLNNNFQKIIEIYNWKRISESYLDAFKEALIK